MVFVEKPLATPVSANVITDKQKMHNTTKLCNGVINGVTLSNLRKIYAGKPLVTVTFCMSVTRYRRQETLGFTCEGENIVTLFYWGVIRSKKNLGIQQ